MGLFKPNIQKMKEANDISGLMRGLAHKNADVRYAAFSVLSNMADSGNDLVIKLKNMVNDPSPKVRTIATLKFADSDDKVTAENLKEIMNDGTQQEKIELLRIIAGRNKNVNESIIQVISLGLADKNKLVKLDAIQTVKATRNRHFINNLVECLNDNLQWVRIQAAKALYEIEGAESISYLIGLLSDRSPEVRGLAQAYLSLMESERARKALHDIKFQQLVRDMNEKESVRRDTAEKIGTQQIREGLPLLYTALNDEYREVRIAALRAIAKFKDPSSVRFIEKLLEDKYQDTRLEAVKALGQIISKDSLKALENVRLKSDTNVRKEAQKTIYKLLQKV